MKSRPILFNGDMVRAVLDGRKTQTRRVVKDVSTDVVAIVHDSGGMFDLLCETSAGVFPKSWQLKSPFGVPGDRLWVRETWQGWQQTSHEYNEWEPLTTENRGGLRWAEWVEEWGRPDSIEYKASSKSVGPWTPSIHMLRWACRIELEVVSVECDRVAYISEEGAEAEGVQFMRDYPDADETLSAKQLFECLWDSIYGKAKAGAADISWAANPWVWVVEFKRVEGGTGAARTGDEKGGGE